MKGIAIQLSILQASKVDALIVSRTMQKKIT
jgi:hypothetical protein